MAGQSFSGAGVNILNINAPGYRPTMVFQGISPTQTIDNYKTSEDTLMRRVLVKSWNNPYATGTVNGKTRITTPFRAVNNLGDFLSRNNYVCGGPNPTQRTRSFYQGRIGAILSQCDDTGVPASSCNVKFVADASDYIKYKKQSATVKNYNKVKFGGDESHGSYDAYVNVLAGGR
jgi:hypothetical protein